VYAKKYRGQEISSFQVLKEADITPNAANAGDTSAAMGLAERDQARALCEAVYITLQEQSEGWKSRSLFERQWVIRDFKKVAGMPVEEWLSKLKQLQEGLQGAGNISHLPLEKLASYYEHLAELAKGYERDHIKLEENLRHVYGWRDEVNRLIQSLN
jgi:hypothetical protein